MMKSSSFALVFLAVSLLVFSFSNIASGQRTVGQFAERTVGQLPKTFLTLVAEKREYQEIYYTDLLEGIELGKAVKDGWEIVCVYNSGRFLKVILKRDRK